MKKTSILRKSAVLLALATVATTMAMESASKNAFYVYRNDGGFNAFLVNEIVRMGFSKIGIDSVTYNNNVVHEIETADSLYRIPISTIDSVSFITPENIVKPEAKDITELVETYLVSQNGLSLTFTKELPSDVLSVGDKIYTLQTSDILPSGFIGKINSIHPSGNDTNVDCDLLYPDEVFDSYCCIIDENEETPTRADNESSSTIPFIKYTFNLNKLHDNIVVNESALHDWQSDYIFDKKPTTADINAESKIKFTGVIVVNKKTGNYFKLSYVFTDNIKLGVSGIANMKGNYNRNLKTEHIQTPWTFMYPSVDYGVRAKINGDFQTEDFKFGGSIVVSGSFEGNIDSKHDETAYLKSKVPTVKFVPANEGKFIGDGSISLGIRPNIIMSFPVSNALEAYAQSDITIELTDSEWINMDKEEMMEGTKGYTYLLTLKKPHLTGTVSGMARGFKGFEKDYSRQLTHALWEKDSYNKVFTDDDYVRVPSFTKEDNNRNDVLKATANGKVLIPVSVGAAIIQDDESIAHQTYHSIPHTNNTLFEANFKGKKKEGQEECPIVKWCGIELQGMFEVGFKCKDDKHPHAIDLGLPSGLKWCCMNVDATKPSDYGGYYAWGDVKHNRPYSDFGWYFDNGNYGDGIVHHLGHDISGTEHDVATVRMGKNWRTPTHEELREMWSHCSIEQAYKGSVLGYRIKGPNGNHIFLPGGGQIYNFDIHWWWDGQADYWTSTTDEINDDWAWGFLLKIIYPEERYPEPHEKGHGLLVRPIYDK